MSKLEVHLLGQFSVLKDEESVEIPSRPAQSLLAYLVMSAGTVHRREKLAGLLWPEANEANARSNLRHSLWRLRNAIGDEYFLADKISIAFNAEADYGLDVALLQREDKEGEAAADLIKGISVCGGELLPGFYEDWVILERERLRALYEKKIQLLLNRLINEERWGDVIEWGERWIAMGQAPEPAYRALMFAYCGLGDTAGMASAYQRCVKALREEIGVDPSEETKATYEHLVKGGKPVAPHWKLEPLAPETEATTAIQNLLKQWRSQGVEVLDIASMAIVQASPSRLPLGDEDVSLLIRSALDHAIEVSPWLEKARSEDVAVQALMEVYDSYPRPRIRTRIVEALKSLEADNATDALLRIALQEDAASIRAEAAVAAAERGQLETVVDGLLEEVNSRNGASAMAAFVAVADEVGLPENIGTYPKFSLVLSLAQRRWRTDKGNILRYAIRMALGGAIAMALVANLQLIPAALMTPHEFQQNLELTSLPLWIFSNVLLGLLWGGLLGFGVGFSTILADSMWKGKTRRRWRWIMGSLAGLIHSFFLILLSLFEGFKPVVDASIFTPVYLLYGILTGGALTLVVPSPGADSSTRSQVVRWMKAAGLIAMIAFPIVYLVYRQEMTSALVLHLMVALFFPLGLALAMIGIKEVTNLQYRMTRSGE